MINFYKEIEEILIENNKKIEDIIWVGTGLYKVDKEKFLKQAKLLKYDNGYTLETINLDLIIAGDNWHLERHEYDGSEWFEFKQILKEPVVIKENIKEFIIPDTYLKDYIWLDNKGDSNE